MTTWQDLTHYEQAALVATALDGTFLLSVTRLAADRDTENPYTHLCSLGLLYEWGREERYVTFTITLDAMDLLLAAPDTPDGTRFFPLASDIAEMKDKLRKRRFGLEK